MSREIKITFDMTISRIELHIYMDNYDGIFFECYR